MKKLITLLILATFATQSSARGVGYMKKVAQVQLGMTKVDVTKLLGMPDYSMGTLKGVEILGFDINRYRNSEEREDLFVAAFFTAGLAYLATFCACKKTYCFIFDNYGKLIEWRALDRWIDDDVRTLVEHYEYKENN
jgi:hypothetical protein